MRRILAATLAVILLFVTLSASTSAQTLGPSGHGAASRISAKPSTANIVNQWYSTLPNTAGSGLAVSRQHPLTAYASGYNGIWKTLDGGNSWTNVSNNIPTPYDNQAIWVAPDDDNIVYVSHFNYGWYKSTDGGTTWQLIYAAPPAGTPGWSALAPSNHDVLYMNTYAASLRTADGGTTWMPTCLGRVTAVDPLDPNIAYSSTPAVKTTDGGQTCISISSLLLNITSELGNGRRLYGYTQNPWAFYYSDDSGANWIQTVGNGFPSGQDIWGFAIDPANRNHLLISSTGNGIRESQDGGNNWSPLDTADYPVGSERSVAIGFDTPSTYYATTNGSGVWQYHVAPVALAYTISGQVTIGHNNVGVPGVAITASPNLSTTTDSSGNYVFNNLPSGSYGLIPSLTGYTFSPASSQTFLPPNATQNFKVSSITFGPGGIPFTGCEMSSAHDDSPAQHDPRAVRKGFSYVAGATCDAGSGVFKYLSVAFGGTDGGFPIVGKRRDPNQEARAEARMVVHFTPQFTGDIRVDTTLLINGTEGAAAGSGLAADIQASDEIGGTIVDYLTHKQVSALDDILKAIFVPTLATARSDAFIQVGGAATATARKEITPSPVASFPVPGPYSQQWQYDNKLIQLSTVVPVTQGQPIFILAGTKSTTDAWGWADSVIDFAHANASRVNSIVLTLQ